MDKEIELAVDTEREAELEDEGVTDGLRLAVEVVEGVDDNVLEPDPVLEESTVDIDQLVELVRLSVVVTS